MLDTQPPQSAPDLLALRGVIDGPLHEIARRLSRFLSDQWPHNALVIFTRECTGRPRKVVGAAEMINKVTIDELEQIKTTVEPGRPVTTTASIGGAPRKVWVVRDPSGTLLVLVPRFPRRQFPQADVLSAVFGVVATSIRQQVTQASPDYLAESRAASAERARTIAELTAAHESALVTILTTLRSPHLGDGRARLAAADTASTALMALRTAQKSNRELSEEPARTAFSRARKDIRQMLRHHEAQLEFVSPPSTGRPIPGEIASAARAMTRAAVLAFTAQPGLARLRIAWTCNDTSLLVDIRDQQSGDLDVAALHRQLHGRAHTLAATINIETVPGWGSRLAIELPLEPTSNRSDENRLTRLNRREHQVLHLVAQGKRNKTIATELGVTESTIKFHVTSVLRKLEVTTRGEAAALTLSVAPQTLQQGRGVNGVAAGGEGPKRAVDSGR